MIMARAGTQRTELERPHIRLALIRDLAKGEETQVQLGARYGVVHSAISQFKDRHAVDIAAVRGKLDDEYAGLWIADKRARLAHYEQQAEDTIDLLHQQRERVATLLEAAEGALDPAGRLLEESDFQRFTKAVEALSRGLAKLDAAGLIRAQQGALKGVAEELGALPMRQTIEVKGSLITYQVEGIDPNDLK